MFHKLFASTNGNGMHPLVRDSLRRLAALSEEIPKESVRPLLAEFASGAASWPHEVAGSSADQATVLARAIAAHVLQAVWTELSAWIVKHPPGLASGVGERRHSIIRLNSDYEPVSLLLSLQSKMLQDAIFAWAAKVEQDGPTEGSDDLNRRLVATYRAFLREGGTSSNPRQFIWQVSDIGLQVIWAIMEAIPEVYQAAYREPITPEKFRQVLRSGYVEEHMKTFSDGAALIVNQLEEMLAIRPAMLLDGRERFVFSPSAMMLVEHHGTLQFAFRPEFMERVEHEVAPLRSRVSMRTGCSARAATEVFQGFWDWSVALAEAFYIPRFPA